jgi:hypothetical protein
MADTAATGVSQTNEPGSAAVDAKNAETSLDASTEADSQLNASPTVNGTIDHPMGDASQQHSGSDTQSAATMMEARVPTKKDATLREFIAKMDEHAPIVSSRYRMRIKARSCS